MTTLEAPPALECPSCGSTVTRGQEYCLECGARLPVPDDDAVRSPSSWLWPVLVALVVAAVSTAGVVAYRLSTDDDDPELVAATTAQPAVIPTTAPPEQPTTSVPPTTAPPPATTQPPSPPQGNRIVSWPDGRSGFTVVLASLPETGGRPAAVAKARDALRGGLRQVGVLRSGDYASLHPGYFVVFAGVYASAGAAQRGLGAARDAGFQPYVRPITQ